MHIIPAIDILGGQCVRLVEGEYDTAHKVAESPFKTAESFEAAGAEYLHVVDLDGAREGRKVNFEVIVELRKKTGLKMELGGGIRDIETVDFYIERGIDKIILGSAALHNKPLVVEAVEKYGEKIAVGIDAKNRMVKTAGWLEMSGVDFIELALEMKKIGVKNIIYTDISRDGKLTGIDCSQYEELLKIGGLEITASGGVRDIEDIKNLKKTGVYAIIAGKSIYSGTLNLAEAVNYTKL